MAQKLIIMIAVILAVLSAFLLVVASFVLMPDQRPIPMPMPEPEPFLNQVLRIFEWLGVAALIAVSAVGVMLLVNRTRHRQKS